MFISKFENKNDLKTKYFWNNLKVALSPFLLIGILSLLVLLYLLYLDIYMFTVKWLSLKWKYLSDVAYYTTSYKCNKFEVESFDSLWKIDIRWSNSTS